MRTPTADEPDPRNLRLALTPDEWRSLRVWAAEEETSMQALVAKTMRSAITTHIRTLAGERVLTGGKRKRGS